MLIEKLNDNQIKCTLSVDDLRERHITVSELSYGTEQARSLFHEMLDEAAARFGFQAEDVPITIDAIPSRSGGLVLLITKSEMVEELDSHLARFSEGSPEDLIPADSEGFSADEILDETGKKADSKKTDSKLEEPPIETQADEQDILRIYCFKELDEIIGLAGVFHNLYSGQNSLYRDPRENVYYLAMHQSWHTPDEFNRICNMMAEYAASCSARKSREAYMKEHFKCIIAETALQRLVNFL